MQAKRFLLVAIALSATSFAATAQNDGYATSGAAGAIWKNPFGLCWRTGHWTPAMANAECDPDLVRKPAAAPRPAPAPAPRAAPAPRTAPKPMAKRAGPAKPVVITITAASFATNKASLAADARAKLDSQVIARMNKEFATIALVHIEGHTDRRGSHQYNQKLSERRADAVAAYLISKGVDRTKVQTIGMGKTNPIKSCPDNKDRKAFAECLAPNRRVTVEIRGMRR